LLWWRSVGSTHTAFSTETFPDELAYAAGRDPVEFRRTLLKHHPRHRGVLELAAQTAGWDVPLPWRRARGIALHESFNSFVAQVAEVSLGHDGRLKVERGRLNQRAASLRSGTSSAEALRFPCARHGRARHLPPASRVRRRNYLRLIGAAYSAGFALWR
jgi:hypothetical protein